MITIRHTQSAAAWWSYYLAHPALSAEEKVGMWVGRACEALGWKAGSTVRGEEFACLLDGYTLDRKSCVGHRLPNRRCGYDLVISAPKSVSIAALCWEDEAGRMLIRNAFNEAVVEVARACEQLVKRQGGAARRVVTGNMAAAVFCHHASRYGDPHLHSHLVIGNVTRVAGKWAAIALDTVYKAHMALNRLFMCDLVRRIRKAGIRASLVKGVCELPVAREIGRRMSSGWGRLESAADRLGLHGRRRPALKAVLNDRLRPRKKAPVRNFDAAVLATEQVQLGRLWRRGSVSKFGLQGYSGEQLRSAVRKLGSPTESNRVRAAAELAVPEMNVSVVELVRAAMHPGLMHPIVTQQTHAARASRVKRESMGQSFEVGEGRSVSWVEMP